MRKMLLMAAVMVALSSPAPASSGSKNSSMSGSYPIVLAHGGLGWGDDNEGLLSRLNYWGGIPAYLDGKGIPILKPNVAPLHVVDDEEETVEGRAEELRRKVLEWKAANNYSKVNIIAHSNGALDTRYMVSLMGMDEHVAVLSFVNGANHGIPFLADVLDVVGPFKAVLNAGLNFLFGAVFTDDDMDTLGGVDSMTPDSMAVFNQNVLDKESVKYYSYGSTIPKFNLIQHPILSLIFPFVTAAGPKYDLGEANDGLIPLAAHKWGTWKGGPKLYFYADGVDHLQATDWLYSGRLWYDVNGYYKDIVENMVSNQ